MKRVLSFAVTVGVFFALGYATVSPTAQAQNVVRRCAGATCGATCDAGYGLIADGGCDILAPACSPDLGRYTDGGCIRQTYPTTPDLCAAFDGGDLVGSADGGGWWCLRGDQTMLAGSAFALQPVNRDAGSMRAPVSWPVFPGGTLLSATEVNDTKDQSWFLEYFTTDGGQFPPTASFTTCMISAFNPGTPIASGEYGAGVSDDGLVRYGAASIKWGMSTAPTRANGSFVTCSVASCASSGNNLVPEEIRLRTLHCAVFTSGDGGANSGSTAACTYIPGDGGVTCVSANHTLGNIGNTKDSWFVGLGVNGIGSYSMLDGWFGGAFMTQRAFTTGDISRIGRATVPGTPTGSTFARNTVRTCCDSSQRCAVIAADVPCGNGAQTVVNPNQELSNLTTYNGESFLSPASIAPTAAALIDGGSRIAPFGATTALQHFFSPTIQTVFCDGGTPRDTFTASYGNAVVPESCQPGVIGNATVGFWAYGDPVDFGYLTPNGLDFCTSGPTACNGPAGATCVPPDGGWAWCELTTNTSITTGTLAIGNLTEFISPNRTSGPTCRDRSFIRVAATTFLTGFTCTSSASGFYLHDYSATGKTTSRGTETCLGPICP